MTWCQVGIDLQFLILTILVGIDLQFSILTILVTADWVIKKNYKIIVITILITSYFY